jgi:hypothetical protein
MKLKTFTLLKHKTYLLSATVLVLAGIFCAAPAYSQVDHFYGIKQKGFSLNLGGGVTVLNSNWSTNPPSYEALLGLDYNFTQYLSLGIEGQYGQVAGKDNTKKAVLYYAKTINTFTGGNLNLKVALGQFVSFVPKNGFQDAIKRIYVGAGIGSIMSDVKLTDHRYDQFASNAPAFGNGKTIQTPMKSVSSDPASVTGTGNATYVPVNFGTYIALRGLLGYDKLELNPNFQYNFVQSKVFDGYQPNAVKDPFIPVNGNQAFYVISLALKYKF